MTEGIDVSRYQSGLNWSSLPTSLQKFTFVKASQGSTEADPDFRAYWLASKGRVLRSAYHFFSASFPGAPPVTGKAQAAQFLKILAAQGDNGELPPMVDMEYDAALQAQLKSAPAQLTAAYQAMVEQLPDWLLAVEKATHRKPIIYTLASFWNEFAKSGTFKDETGNVRNFSEYPLFLATGFAGELAESCPTPPAPWKYWTFWQDWIAGADQSGPIEGIGFVGGALAVDTDKFDGNLADLAQFVRDTGGTPAPLPPAPSTH